MARIVPCHLDLCQDVCSSKWILHEWYLLYDVFQRMELGLLEVVRPVDGIKPDIEEVLCPLAVPDGKAARRKTVLVLSEDKVYPVALEVAECLDDTVWWDDGRIAKHCRLELRRCEQPGVDWQAWIHDEGGVVDVPEPGRAWVKGHGMAHGGDSGPGNG